MNSKIPCSVWNGVQQLKYAHLKIDGHFTVLRNNRIYSSQGTDLTEQVGRLKPELLMVRDEAGIGNVTVFGELYYPLKPASYIKSGIANRDKKICFSAFALDSVDIKPNADLEYIEKIVVDCYGLQFTPYIKLNHPFNIEYLVSETLPLLSELTDHRLDGGRAITEGFVFKDGNLLNWQKYKLVKTIDCVILGFTPGQGKYVNYKNTGKNLIGSIRCGVFTKTFPRCVEIATASGFSDEIRVWLTDNKDSNNKDSGIINKQVIEVSYQAVGANGRLRHPQFINWRDDKLAADCKTDQDLDLLEYWK